ncbi:MAG TPA: hypothetical protein VIS96_09650 [Terrimicrobiaceae bacterium]
MAATSRGVEGILQKPNLAPVDVFGEESPQLFLFRIDHLSRLARSAEQLARRVAAERRAEQARFEAAELEQTVP